MGNHTMMWPRLLVGLLYFPFVSLQNIRGEISGGVDASPNSFPFMLRLHIRGARGREGRCAGSLIHKKFFISALHCFSEGFDFWRHCLRRGTTNNRCYAVVREHFVNSFDEGEVKINIVNIYEAPSENNDLVVGELERPVVLDSKAQTIAVSTLPLKAGDIVTTAGWGLFGPTGGLSNVLLRRGLIVSVGGEGEIVRTKVGRSKSGTPIDPCEGDSGGPLLKWSDDLGTYALHATLNGGGYDCIQDSINGDGIWNSVFPHTKWIENFVRGE